MFLSIIVVNYNGDKWLSKLMESLFNQTEKDYEVILVDNGSIDCSIDLIKERFKKVKIIRSLNEGYGKACNKGIKYSKGDYALFLNEDMYVDKEFVEKIKKYIDSLTLSEIKKLGSIGCHIHDYEGDPFFSKNTYGFRLDIIGTHVPNFDKEKIFSTGGCPFIVKKENFKRIGGFCENIFLYGEDVDINWRINLYGMKNHFLEDVYLYHYVGGSTGKFSPFKLAHYIKGELICLINNYSLLMLFIALFANSLFNAFLTTYFLMTLKWKLIIGVINGYIYVFRDIKSIISYRHIVQKNRVVSDIYILKKGLISFIPSRIQLLVLKEKYKFIKK